MKRILLVGCSFVETLYAKQPVNNRYQFIYQSQNNFYKICGQPGAGNAMLAQIVLNEMLATKDQQPFDEVIVLWSGIKRLDIAVSPELAKLAPIYRRWARVFDNTVWMCSGGECGSWTNFLPSEIKNIFKSCYKGATNGYFTDLSYGHIIATQRLLETEKIPYKMSFIYDVNQTYPDRLDHMLGIVTDSRLHAMIDWDKFRTVDGPIFDWAKEKNLLQKDNFHPLESATKIWLNENFDLDLS